MGPVRWSIVRDRLRALAMPAAVGAFALALRLYGLGAKPFWLDEVTSLHRATGSVHDLVLDALHNRHYPSYFLLLWLVARIGAGEFLLRLPSALFGALAAGLTAAIGRRAAGPRVGAIAGLMLALSPLEVQLGQEARSYTLVACLIMTALWGLLQLAEAPTAAAQGKLHGAWLAYCLGTAAALSVLGVAAPWLLAANLAAIAIAVRAGTARRAFVRRWALAQGVVLALWAPSLAALWWFSGRGWTNGAGWAPPETPAAVWTIFAPVYLMRLSNFISFDLAPAMVPGLALLIAGLAAAGLWRLRREPPVLVVLAAAALLLPALVLLLSPWVPVLVPRYLAWSAAPFFILAACGLQAVAGRGSAVAAAALTAACIVNLLPSYAYETKPRWDLAAARLAAEAQPGDVALADRGYTYYVVKVYADRVGLAARGVRLTRNLAVAKDAAPGHDLWALYGRVGQQEILPPDEYLHSLAALGQPVAAYPVGRYITLYRFQVPPPAAADTQVGPASPQP
jgi:mannosyltransferase